MHESILNTGEVQWLSANPETFLSCLGMLALEMLGRRAHNDHPNNFSRSPPYTEDVKWLLGLAARLGMLIFSWLCHFQLLTEIAEMLK